ncbi:hypothetical protein BsWGS_09311 [Bradybaena similaris]
MEGRQYVTIICCLLVAILVTLCHSQTWRPQGRFGKRVSSRHFSAEADSPRHPSFGLSNLLQIPVELFFSEKEVEHMKTKPRLCSVSGLHGYPACDFVTSSSWKDAEDVNKYFDI